MENGLTDEALCLRRLSFRYADSVVPALSGVSMTVRRGETAAVMGASGAGKSTLVKCAARVVPAFEPGELRGEVRLFGRPAQAMKVGDLGGTVGVVFQDFEAQLFCTTVRDEVVFGMEQVGVEPGEMARRAAEALRQVGLERLATRDPTTLSGGEKQRLAIAALLALRPKLLLLDEPTTDLDPAGREEVFGVLARLRAQRYALVVVEHELAAAEDADTVVLLREGAVAAEGPPQVVLPDTELLGRCGVRAADVDRLFALLGLRDYPREAAQAAAFLKDAGLVPRPERVAALRAMARPAPARAAPFLELQGVSYAYARGKTVLDHVDLTLHEGELVALLGANGSGKTTLAKHLCGLLAPTRGRVLLRGQPPSRIPPRLLAQEVGYVFQNPDHQLFTATVEDEVAAGPRNIGLSPPQVEERVATALATVGLRESRQRDPFVLSKGERQRLAVASVLALEPRCLILDEPTTGLDYGEQRRMMDLVRNLHARGVTVIIITHVSWVAAQYADRAWLLERGRLIWDGDVRELLGRDELLARGSFRPPAVTRLGRLLGVTARTVEELVWCLGR